MRTGTRRLVPTLVGVTLLTTFLPLAAPRPVAAAAPTDLFFSEYIEGSSNNKALEIYNGTGAPVVLDADSYNVQMFFNGATTAGGLNQPRWHRRRWRRLRRSLRLSANAAILAQADETERGRLVQRRRRRRAAPRHAGARRHRPDRRSIPAPSGAPA